MKVSIVIYSPNTKWDKYSKDLIAGDDYESIDDVSFTLTALNSTGAGTQLSFTEEITFLGDIVNIFKEVFIKSEITIESYVTISAVDDCCGVDIVLAKAVVTSEDFKFCLSNGDSICKISTDLRAADASAIDYVCIRSALINDPSIRWDNGKEFRYQRHPAVPYCNSLRPAFAGLILKFLVAISVFLFLSFLPLIVLISVIVSAINLVLGILQQDKIDFDSSLEGNQSFIALVRRLLTQELNLMVTGCGFNHSAPLVRSYIKNVCLQCGDLELSSTILSDPSSIYYNMAMVGPTIRKGNRPLYEDNKLNEVVAARYWKYNTPIMTGGEFLDRLATLFNAQWWVEGTTLYFEQAVTQAEPIMSTDDNNLDIASICLESDEDRVYSGINLKYEQDGVDVVGDEARYLYNDVVPFYDIADRDVVVKRKLREVSMLFGSSRYQGDRIDDEDAWGVSVAIDVLYIGAMYMISFILGGDYRPPKAGPLTLEKDVMSLGKLIILKNNYDVKYALVIEDDRHYNYPLWFSARAYGGLWINSDPSNSSKVAIVPNMWQFWKDDDVRIKSSRLNAYSAVITLTKTCIWYKDFMQTITSDLSKKHYVNIRIDNENYSSIFNSIQISGSKIVIKTTLI